VVVRLLRPLPVRRGHVLVGPVVKSPECDQRDRERHRQGAATRTGRPSRPRCRRRLPSPGPRPKVSRPPGCAMRTGIAASPTWPRSARLCVRQRSSWAAHARARRALRRSSSSGRSPTRRARTRDGRSYFEIVGNGSCDSVSGRAARISGIKMKRARLPRRHSPSVVC